MKNLLLVFFLLPLCVFSQIEFKKVNSEILQESRRVKIQLPRGYDSHTEKSYPVIFVLDGDYLFEPVAGNVDYYSYWDEMPEAIVVGILQDGSRREDTQYNHTDFLPKNQGADFFEFVGGELLPIIDKNYRTKKFDIIIGQDITANFINYYLFKKNPLFKGYVNLSPDYANKMQPRLQNTLQQTKTPVWYYLATGGKDLPELKTKIKAMDALLKQIDNPKLHYTFNDFEGATHYTLVGNAIPKALEAMFSTFRPIGQKDIDELVKEDASPYDYLQKKYQNIEDLYGLNIKIRVHDFMQIARAIEKTEKWDDYKSLGKLAEDVYPQKMIGKYFNGRFYEENGRLERAVKSYKEAYALKGVPGLHSEDILDRIDQIKADLKH